MPGEYPTLCHVMTQSAELLQWSPLHGFSLETACCTIVGERDTILYEGLMHLACSCGHTAICAQV